MKLRFAFAAVLACLSDSALAQDKRLEAVCGNLFGARQTAIRLAREGWPLERIVQETLNRPEWRSASMQDQKMLFDMLQETMSNPGKQSSDVIRDCMQRAESTPAPKSQ
jgi:hypothetical protein